MCVGGYDGPGEYVHFKGGHYYAAGLGIHAHAMDAVENFSPRDPSHHWVAYHPLDEGNYLESTGASFFYRRLSEFNEHVPSLETRDGHAVELVPRFRKINS